MRPEIQEYYRRGGEVDRLAGGRGRLEFLRTWDILTHTLPPAPATVLDVGGATGVYAGPLAAAGYHVHVVDPVADHVVITSQMHGVSAAVGDARHLEEPDACVDAVLLLGPLYHLLERDDRIAAWREAARVLRPGGVVVAATISRFTSLLEGFVQGYHSDPEFMSMVRHTLGNGEHLNPAAERNWFTTAYFHHPAELPREVAAAGLTLDRIAAVEGPMWMLPNLDELLADEASTALLLHQIRVLENEPNLWGASLHLLTVARRPRPAAAQPAAVSAAVPVAVPEAAPGAGARPRLTGVTTQPRRPVYEQSERIISTVC